MSIGYLVTVGLYAWCTAFAVAPPKPAHSSPWNLAFVFGFVVNEVPFVVAYLVAAATVQAALGGDLNAPLGWVPVGLAVASVAGLAVLVRRGLAAGPALAAALDDGFTGAPRPPVATKWGVRRWLRILVWPWPILRRDVERVANLRYGPAGRMNRLDVYRHRSHPSGGPVLVHFHGGAFRHGAKNREARPLLHRFAALGWVCISANYRLGRRASFPDYVIDAKRVIAWAREHGEEFGADPTTLFVAGSSAGGHIAAVAALTANDPRFQPGFEAADTSVAGAVTLYAFYGSAGSSEGMPSSPHDYLTEQAPPFFVAHGDNDTLVLVEGARRFVADLRRSSSHAVVYAELPGAQHCFDLFHSIRFEAVVDAIVQFTSVCRRRSDRTP